MIEYRGRSTGEGFALFAPVESVTPGLDLLQTCQITGDGRDRVAGVLRELDLLNKAFLSFSAPVGEYGFGRRGRMQGKGMADLDDGALLELLRRPQPAG